MELLQPEVGEVVGRMSRAALRRVLKRHYGSIVQLSRDMQPPRSHVLIVNWLRGRGTSAHVEVAVRRRVNELLEEEKRNV